MTAFNAVRFRVKPGREQEFLDAHKKVERSWAGLQRVNIIKTGDRTYCIIAEWTDMDEARNVGRPLSIAPPKKTSRAARRGDSDSSSSWAPHCRYWPRRP